MTVNVFPGSYIDQGFGCTTFALEWVWPACPTGYFHPGIDLTNGECNDPVYATRPGKVVKIGGEYLGPLAVWLQLADGSCLLYGHLGADAVSLGEQIATGRIIGFVGSLGLSTGCHLHFERQQTFGSRGPATASDPTAYLTGEDQMDPELEAFLHKLKDEWPNFYDVVGRIFYALRVQQASEQPNPALAISHTLDELRNQVTGTGALPLSPIEANDLHTIAETLRKVGQP